MHTSVRWRACAEPVFWCGCATDRLRRLRGRPTMSEAARNDRSSDIPAASSLMLPMPRTEGPAHDSAATKAVRLLLNFSMGSTPVPASHLARAAGLSRSTTHRLLGVLEEQGVARRSGAGWVVGPRLLDLATSAGADWGSLLGEVSRPWLVDAHPHARHCALHVAVMDVGDVVYVDKIGGPNSRQLPTRPGLRVRSELTAVGRAIRGHRMRVVRSSQESIGSATAARPKVAVDYGRTFAGVACVAAPVIRRGEAVGAVSVSGPQESFDAEELAKVVVWVAGRISLDLGALTSSRRG